MITASASGLLGDAHGDGRADPVHDARQVSEIIIVESLGEGPPQELVMAQTGLPD